MCLAFACIAAHGTAVPIRRLLLLRVWLIRAVRAGLPAPGGLVSILLAMLASGPGLLESVLLTGRTKRGESGSEGRAGDQFRRLR